MFVSNVRNRSSSSGRTYFALLGEDGDVVALGRLDVGAHEALALVGHPARRLGVVRRRLLHQLLAVERQELEVRVAGERVGERHGDGGEQVRAGDEIETTTTTTTTRDRLRPVAVPARPPPATAETHSCSSRTRSISVSENKLCCLFAANAVKELLEIRQR